MMAGFALICRVISVTSQMHSDRTQTICQRWLNIQTAIEIIFFTPSFAEDKMSFVDINDPINI